MNEMTEEQWKEHLRQRDVTNQLRGRGVSVGVGDILHSDAVDEIYRLRGENERLTEDLRVRDQAYENAKSDRDLHYATSGAMREVLRDIAYNTSTSVPLGAYPETFIAGQLRSCIGRAAHALNSEPSS